VPVPAPPLFFPFSLILNEGERACKEGVVPNLSWGQLVLETGGRFPFFSFLFPFSLFGLLFRGVDETQARGPGDGFRHEKMDRGAEPRLFRSSSLSPKPFSAMTWALCF